MFAVIPGPNTLGMLARIRVPLGELGAAASISMPAFENVLLPESDASEDPAARSAAAHEPRPAPCAVVVPDVLDTKEGGLRTPKRAPVLDAVHHVTADVDPPVEVVRRQEHEVPAAVAEALDGVVLPCSDVLVVSGEDQ
jgi:hypothetical protein